MQFLVFACNSDFGTTDFGRKSDMLTILNYEKFTSVLILWMVACDKDLLASAVLQGTELKISYNLK